MRKLLTALGYFFMLLTIIIVFSEKKGDSFHTPALFEWRTFKMSLLCLLLGAAFLAARNWFYPAQPPSRQDHRGAPVVHEPRSTFRVIESAPRDEPQEAPKRYSFYDWALADPDLLS